MSKKTSQKAADSKLRWIIRFEGITADFLAKRINTSRAYIQQIVAKPEVCSQEKRIAIAKVLNRPYEEVFGKVRPFPQIMIAVPEQQPPQAQA